MSEVNKAITLQQAKTLYDDLRQRQENIPSAENIVMVQDQQPTIPANKVWLTETPPAGVDVPTYQEFTGVIAPDYADLDYPVSSGEHCIHNGVYYTALQSINSAEEWTAAHWEATSVSDELRILIARQASHRRAMAIPANGNTHGAISSGQYVYVYNHDTLDEGMYTASSSISSNGTLSSSNLTQLTVGMGNSLLSRLVEKASRVVIDRNTGSSCADCDAVTDPGCYRVIYSTLNKPSNISYGTLVYFRSNDYHLQIIVSTNGTKMDVRAKGPGSWNNAWQVVSMTALSS